MKYIGSRYVPKFMGSYDNTQIYEALSVVDNGLGTSYISKKIVPAGTPLTDTSYWAIYGASSGAIINLQNQIDDLKKVSDNTINLKELGAVGDGINDDAPILQYAVDNFSKIFIPEGTYKLASTIDFTRDNVEIIGAGCSRWAYGTGMTILAPVSSLVFDTNGRRTIKIHDIDIEGVATAEAIELSNGSYTIDLSNIVVKNAKTAVHVSNAWNYTFTKVIAEGCIDGFIFEEGTSASIIDCIAYQSTTGIAFDIEGMNYSSFINCGSDHCMIGFKLKSDNRGISFISCGVEVATAGCFVIDGTNIESSIIAPNIGDHSTMSDYIFKILNAAAYLSIYDCKLATSFTPASPYGVISNSVNAPITLIGCMLGSRIGNIGSYCTNLGSHMINNIPQILTAISFYSKKDSVSITSNASETLTTLETNSTYIVTAQQVASTDQGNSAIISIPTAFSGANVQSFRSSANCTFTVDNSGNLNLSNDTSSNRNYYWSVIKIS